MKAIAARHGVSPTMTDLATFSSTGTDSRFCISNQSEGIRQMAAKKTDLAKELLRKTHEVCEYYIRTGNLKPLGELVGTLDDVMRVITQTGARKAIEQPELKKGAPQHPAKKSRKKATASPMMQG